MSFERLDEHNFEPRNQTDNSLDIQDYLDASSDATKRTRATLVSLMIGSVLVFSVFINSLNSNWMHERMLSLAKNEAYRSEKIGKPPENIEKFDQNNVSHIEYMERYKAFYAAIARLYAENTFVVKVPFFGVTFDTNDTGIIGGLGFLIILLILRFCLAREYDNLIISFEKAKQLGKLDAFYHLLAMRQVFTVPKTKHTSKTVHRGKELLRLPKLISVLPGIVHMLIVFHDLMTASVGEMLGHAHTVVIVIGELMLLALIIYESNLCLRRLKSIDQLWEESWIEGVADKEYKKGPGADFYM